MTYLLRTCNADGASYDGFRWPLACGYDGTAPLSPDELTAWAASGEGE